MTNKEEDFVLDTLLGMRKIIRNSAFKQLLKETHENNVMLKQICKVINIHLLNHNQENANDFGRNILANLISNGRNLNKFIK